MVIQNEVKNKLKIYYQCMRLKKTPVLLIFKSSKKIKKYKNKLKN